MQFSTYQKAIFEFIASGEGHAFVKARAGSGKTATLVEAAKRATGSKIFVAFNRSIATELQDRLGEAARACTAHSYGYATVRSGCGRKRVKVDKNKYRDLIRDAAERLRADIVTSDEIAASFKRGEHVRPCMKMLELIRLNCERVCADTVRTICRKHQIELPDWLSAVAAARIIGLARKAGQRKLASVDFVDMVALPVEIGYMGEQYEFVFVDEAQDLSPCLLALVRGMIAPGGRAVFVGDPAQAIYGFAGADVDSVDTIVRELECTVLPLSICYRCPTSVIELAQQVVPDIEARDGAPAGIVATVDEADLEKSIPDEAIVICRVNAPLIGLCFGLLAAGRAATIKGRDIGRSLIKIVERAHRIAGAWIDIRAGIAEVHVIEERKLQRAKVGRDDDAYTALADRFQCVEVILDASGATSLAEFEGHVEDMFSDKRSPITLSSIHRSKGLEADHVFIHPQRLAGPMPAGEIECGNARQEAHLRYVAITRAKQSLTWIGPRE